MFEAKSYNDLRRTFAAANGLFAAICLALAYGSVFTPSHKVRLHNILEVIKVDPVWGSILTIALIGAAWGFLSTYLVRFHDRVYEPHLVSWRASYETDYILRGLCAGYIQRIPETFYEKAFNEENFRSRLMQRLFYKFTGDNKSAHLELLERFYTTIQNYWVLVLAEFYCLAFLMFSAIYCYLARQQAAPYRTWFAVLVISVALRVYSNRYLRNIRPITAEQIHVVLDEHSEDFAEALKTILDQDGGK